MLNSCANPLSPEREARPSKQSKHNTTHGEGTTGNSSYNTVGNVSTKMPPYAVS